jgi:hypothetical protein
MKGGYMEKKKKREMEDMFTPEGIAISSPIDIGMKGIIRGKSRRKDDKKIEKHEQSDDEAGLLEPHVREKISV